MAKKTKRAAARAANVAAVESAGVGEATAQEAEQLELGVKSPWKTDIRELIWRHRWALILLLLAFAAYFPTLRGEYIWDDDQHVVGNEAVTTWSGLGRIWTDSKASPNFYPLTMTSFWLEHKLWGLGQRNERGILIAPAGFHVTNILFQGIAAMGLYALLVKLKLRGGAIAAWLAAAIWLVHPVNVESVAWITERKNVMGAAFFFPSLYMFLRAMGVIAAERVTPKYWDWAWGFGLFIMALLCKTVMCVMPAVVLVILWWKNGRITGRDWLRSVPIFVVGLGLAYMAIRVENSEHVGTLGAQWQFSIGQRVLIAGNALWFYVGKVMWPYPLMEIYPRWDVQVGNAALWAGPLAWVAMVGVLVALSRKITRGPAAAAMAFTVILSPALGFINFYTMLFTFVADHYQHMASAVVIVAAVEMILSVARRLGGARNYGNLAGGFGIAVMVVLTGLTLFYGKKYQDRTELWGYTVKHNPSGFYPRINLAIALMQEGKPEEAEIQLKESVRLEPHDWRHYHWLMLVYLERDDFVSAERVMDLAEPKIPVSLQELHRSVLKTRRQLTKEDRLTLFPELELAMALERKNRIEDARRNYLRAMKKVPDYPATYVGLGNCAVQMDDLAGAEKWYREAVSVDANYAEGHLMLGIVLRKMGREEEGMRELLRAKELAPDILLQYLGSLQALSTQQAATQAGGTLPGVSPK